jgi:hypothetical protein
VLKTNRSYAKLFIEQTSNRFLRVVEYNPVRKDTPQQPETGAAQQGGKAICS